jgi:hypothetical protein
VVVHVGLLAVFGLFLLLAVIVAVRQRVVVVLVGMPVRAMFPLVQRIVRVVMRDVIVVVTVGTSGCVCSGCFPSPSACWAVREACIAAPPVFRDIR